MIAAAAAKLCGGDHVDVVAALPLGQSRPPLGSEPPSPWVRIVGISAEPVRSRREIVHRALVAANILDIWTKSGVLSDIYGRSSA